jgi:predicted transcriptional regulator
MATTTQPNKRKIGVHISLDLDSLGQLDEIAARMRATRSQAMRRMIEEFAEMEEEALWAALHADKAFEEPRVPWDEVKAEFGL